MKSRIPNSLKKHVEKFYYQNNFGDLLKFEELLEEDKTYISNEVFSTIKYYEDAYDAYMHVLSKYYIMCPHPQQKRTYPDGKQYKYNKNTKWFNCTMCKCAVINELYYEDLDTPLESAK